MSSLTEYVNTLKPAELKKFITGINKYVRADLIIKIRGKTHEQLKADVNRAWQILKYNGVLAFETRNLKEMADLIYTPSEKEKERAIIRQAKQTIRRVSNKLKMK